MEFPQAVDFKAVYGLQGVLRAIQYPDQARRVVTLACQAAIAKRGVAVVILPADIPRRKRSTTCRSGARGRAGAAPVGRGAAAHRRPDRGRADRHLCRRWLRGRARRAGGPGRGLKAPIAHTSRAKDFVEPDNPYNMGMTGILGIAGVSHGDGLRHAAAARLRLRVAPVLPRPGPHRSGRPR